MQLGQRCVRRVHHVTISSITWFKAKHRVLSQNCSSGKWPRPNQGLMDHHSLVYTPLAPYQYAVGPSQTEGGTATRNS